MRVGVFSPVINRCGGAEWVAVNIIADLKEHGHKVILLTDNLLDQKKFETVFNRTVSVDQQVIFPLGFFNSPTDYHNLYTDSIRSLTLKSKCDILVDTFSNALLPGVDIAYIHHPLLRKVEMELPFIRNKIFFYPYQCYLKSRKIFDNKLIFANSQFTAEAIKFEFGIDPHVLYPPISNSFLNNNQKSIVGPRSNTVITIARISIEKNLEIIPYIANSTREDIFFTIVGLLDSDSILESLKRLIKKFKINDRVKIFTNVNRDTLRKYLLASKVYLHPVIKEHFGVSIIEAMSLGCVPIVHDSGGPKEFVPQHLRFKNIWGAAEKVEHVIDNWSKTQSIAFVNSSKRFSEKNFSEYFMKLFNSYFKNK